MAATDEGREARSSDKLREEMEEQGFFHILQTRTLGRSALFLDRTGSTNDVARELAEQGCPHGQLVVADHQEKGRGSRGRSWSSPPGTDLYFSLVIDPQNTPSAELPLFSLVLGLALAECIETFLSAQVVHIKWPNDIWVNAHKLCGILVETTRVGHQAGPLIAGIGLNVNRQRWPERLDTPPTSLAQIAGLPFSRSDVLAKVLGAIETRCEQFLRSGFGPMHPAIESRLALRAKPITLDGKPGTLLGLSPQGTLQIQTPAGLSLHAAGTLRPA